MKLAKSSDVTVTYHDPCHLGRLGEPWIHWKGRRSPATASSSTRRSPTGAGQTVSTSLRARCSGACPGVTLTEMDRIKEYAWCGGACGGVTDSNPEFAEWTAAERT